MKLKQLLIGMLLITCTGSFFHSACQSKRTTDYINNPALEAEADHLLQPFVKEDLISGSILIAKGNKIVLTKGYGFADKEKGILNTPETKFRICSMTKMITGIAVLILQERRMLDIQDPISKYIKGIQNGNNITLFHLLTHTSGIPGYDLDRTRETPVELETIIGWIREIKPISNPGDEFIYSNSGFVLLSEVIQKVSGLPYEDFVRENIFKPCSMKNSGLFSRAKSISRMALGYTKKPYGPTIPAKNAPSGGKGAGDLYTTVLDLHRLGRTILKGDLLSTETWNQAFQPFKKGWGLACRVEPIEGQNQVHHGGGADGFMSEFRVLRDAGIIVITLCNHDYLLTKAVLEPALVKIALGKQWKPLYKDHASFLETFKQFLGEYPIDDGESWKSSFRLTMDNNHIYFQEKDKPRCFAYPITKNTIFIKEANYRISFQMTEKGTASYFGVFGLIGLVDERKTNNY